MKKGSFIAAWVVWAIITPILFKWVGISMSDTFRKVWEWITARPKEIASMLWGITTAVLMIWTLIRAGKETPSLTYASEEVESETPSQL